MGTLHICGGKPAAHSSGQGDPPCFHPPSNASARVVSARPTMSWCWSTNHLANSRHRSKNAQHSSKTSLPAGPPAPFWPTWIALKATPSASIAEIKSLMNEKLGAKRLVLGVSATSLWQTGPKKTLRVPRPLRSVLSVIKNEGPTGPLMLTALSRPLACPPAGAAACCISPRSGSTGRCRTTGPETVVPPRWHPANR